jgi:hypothetical protein
MGTGPTVSAFEQTTEVRDLYGADEPTTAGTGPTASALERTTKFRDL